MVYAPPECDAVADSGQVVRPLEFWPWLPSAANKGIPPVSGQ